MPVRSRAKPRIVVSDVDHKRIDELAAGAVLSRFREVAEELQIEMDRAKVVPAGKVPSDVVRMGSTVEFRSAGGQHRRVTLVFPSEADISASKVSILTPIGTALIGLSTGQTIGWTTVDGRKDELTIIGVEQPASVTAE
jgi:regulator of nucleoside diphosphate kinase